MENNFIAVFKNGFKKTSSQIKSIFTGNKVDEEVWDKLEEQLILSDIGAELVDVLIEKVKKDRSAMKNPETLLVSLRKEAAEVFPQKNIAAVKVKPLVTLVVGVNGSGKTTSIAKLAKIYKDRGEKVLLCAADTFRAAAVEQLKMWADRLGVDIIAPPEESDPAAVAFDGVSAGVKGEYDRVVIDTAGRLHTKSNLMQELRKIYRVVDKAMKGAPHEVLLVLDGTAGQNSLVQARAFNEATPVTGIIITKLDGTAKGGIVLNVAHELNIPIEYVGLGEKAEDLAPFDARTYVEAVFSL